MDKRELLLTVEAVSNEKNILKDDVFRGLEFGLAKATDKINGEGHRVEIDQDNGGWTTVNIDEITVSNIEVGRINNQIIKNTLFQHVKEVSEQYKVSRMIGRVGEVINCKIQRVNKSSYIVALADGEYILPHKECIGKERFRVGEIVSAVIKSSVRSGKDNIYLSRKDQNLVVALMDMEIPEISDGSIEIVGCQRAPGFKTKVVVRAKDARLDAVGICIGMKGTRVKTITEELGGEFIEIIPWLEDTEEMIHRIIDGDCIEDIIIEDEICTIIVEDEFLGMAIGRGGINIGLVQKVIGIKSEIIGNNAYIESCENTRNELIKSIAELLNIDVDQSAILVDGGFDSIELISEMDVEIVDELFESEGGSQIIEDALDQMLVTAMNKADEWEELQKLLDNDDIVEIFLEGGLSSINAVADLSVDELDSLVNLGSEWCGEMIISSRKMKGMI